MSDGGMAISSQVVVGTKSSYSGDIRTGETYLSNQSSQIEVTSTQLSGGQWIGAAVRAHMLVIVGEIRQKNPVYMPPVDLLRKRGGKVH